jgi:hypothetical protein
MFSAVQSTPFYMPFSQSYELLALSTSTQS